MPRKIATVFAKPDGGPETWAEVTGSTCPCDHGTRVYRTHPDLAFLIGKSVPDTQRLVNGRGWRWRVRYETVA